MEKYKVPWGEATAEYVEKKSRFIGHIFPITSAEEAAEHMALVRKKHYDARHHVYAYVLRDGVMRYSDDGEPQGTAGMPTLEVLKKEQVFDVLCVTVRYFGGTLLGAGGLTRAYGKAAKLALDEAGTGVMRPVAVGEIICPYPLLDPIRRFFESADASEVSAEYLAEVRLTVHVPDESWEHFAAKIVDMSQGKVCPSCTNRVFLPQKEE